MEHSQIKIGGAVVFWKLEAEFNRGAVVSGFASIGMDDYAPDERPDGQCLKEALADEFNFLDGKGKTVMVNALKEKGAFEVVLMEKGEQQNDYRQVCWAKAKEGEISLYNTNGHSPGIRERFAARKAVVSGSQVSQSLINMLDDRQAVSLRPNGGVYWIPASLIGWWSRVCGTIEKAGGGKTACYCLSTVHDPDMVRAVAGGIADEVDKVVREINNEMFSDAEKSSDDYRKLRDKARNMGERLKSYEVHLDSSLSALRAAIEETETAAATARLAQAAQECGMSFA